MPCIGTWVKARCKVGHFQRVSAMIAICRFRRPPASVGSGCVSLTTFVEFGLLNGRASKRGIRGLFATEQQRNSAQFWNKKYGSIIFERWRVPTGVLHTLTSRFVALRCAEPNRLADTLRLPRTFHRSTCVSRPDAISFCSLHCRCR